MTRYNDPLRLLNWDGDHDDQMHDQFLEGYQEGVDRVLELVDGETAFQIREFIREGTI